MLMLRLKPLSKAYLTRTGQRLTDAEHAAFTARGRGIPNASDGAQFARIALKELEIVPADAFLLRGLVDLVPKALVRFGDNLTRARLPDPPGSAIPQALQARHAELAVVLDAALGVLREQSRSSGSMPVRAVLDASMPALEQALETRILTPFLEALVDQIQIPLSRMAYYSTTLQSNSISPYMEDLRDRVDYIRRTLLPRYRMGSKRNEMYVHG